MKNIFRNISTLIILSLSSPITYAQKTANVIYTNGNIYTVNSTKPWAESVAILNGNFISVGSNKDTMVYSNSNTTIIDLNGAFVMPSLIDEHIHPDMGADNYVNVFLQASDSWSTVTKKIQTYRNQNPSKKWIYGGNLNWLADDNKNIASTSIPSSKYELDKIVADRPVALWDQGAHAMLLNTLALAELGITDGTPNPSGGVIVRDKTGAATGVLRETACTMAFNLVDNMEVNEWTEKGMLPFMNELTSYGITGINDAYGTQKNIDSYSILEKDNKLNIRVHLSLATPLEYNDPILKQKQDKLIREANKYTSELIFPNGIKYIMDGSAGGQTAAMIDPFHGTTHRGDLRYSFEDVANDFAAYEKLGYALKAHAIGDRSIRGALDLLKTLPKKQEGTLHSISHGVFISPEDIPRFSEEEVLFEASPALWFPNDGEAVIRADIGDRTERLWPIKELIRTGATVSYGSDWTVSLTPNPWIALETIVTREKPGGSKETLDAKHAIELDTAIEIFTLNGAKAIGLSQITGSIETGKSADMIILDRNLFKTNLRKIHQTKVLKTVFKGNVVYQN